MSKESALKYIDSIAPKHSRTSCAEDSWNAAFVLNGTFYNYCERCTLIRISQLALDEIQEKEDD